MTVSAAPTVRELHVRPVAVPLDPPHRTASGVIQESPLVLLDVVTDDGSVGHAMVFTYTRPALLPTAELLRNLAPLLADEPLAPVELAQKLARRFRLLGTQGLVGMALAGIDMALWDALARCHGVSLARLLGGVEKRVPAYGAVGYDGERESARVAESWAKRGFRGVKAKVGYPSVAEDLAVVRAMRSAVGDDVALMVDFNQSLDPVNAETRLRALDDAGLGWFEEPVLAHDHAGHARVAAAVKTPVQAGENWWGPLDFRHALEARAVDRLMPDVMKVGGVTGWQAVAALAATHGLPLTSHLWPELSTQLLCVSPTGDWLEYCDWWNPVLAEPLAVKDGLADPAGVIGSGVAWNEAAVARFLV
ncbi:MAG TPA: enolase C-terminal domain-like protein [Gammaproteobacteria bacterium]